MYATAGRVEGVANHSKAVKYASSSRGCKTAELVLSGIAARTSPGHAMGGALRLRLPESEVGDADPHHGIGVAETSHPRRQFKDASSSSGCKTAELTMSGFAARTNAAPLDTCGHAMDVPLRLRLSESEV